MFVNSLSRGPPGKNIGFANEVNQLMDLVKSNRQNTNNDLLI